MDRWNRTEFRNIPTHHWTTNFQQKHKDNSVVKGYSSRDTARTTQYSYEKEKKKKNSESQFMPYTIYKT